MKLTSIVGFFGGVCTLLSSFFIGLIGWPVIRNALEDYREAAEVIGWLRAIWYWSAVSLFAMGAMVVREAALVIRGARVNRSTIITVASAEVFVGVSLLLRFSWNPFLGLLLLLGLLTSVLLLSDRTAPGIDSRSPIASRTAQSKDIGR